MVFNGKIKTIDCWVWGGEKDYWKYNYCCGLLLFQGQELPCELGAFWLCLGSLCCTQLCLGGGGTLIQYLLPRAAGKLVFHSSSCENCFYYLSTILGLWGSWERSLNSCDLNDVAILVGSPSPVLSNPCCSSLFPIYAHSPCFIFSLTLLYSTFCIKWI